MKVVITDEEVIRDEEVITDEAITIVKTVTATVKTVITSLPVSDGEHPTDNKTTIITAATVTAFIVVIITVMALLSYVLRRWILMYKKHQMRETCLTTYMTNTLGMVGHKGHSPPLQKDSWSDYCSVILRDAHNTMQFENGSILSPVIDISSKYQAADTPLSVARTEIKDDNELVRVSRPVFEHKVSGPSLNSSVALSHNMSLSN